MKNSLKNKVKVLGGVLLLGLAVVGSAFTKAPELKQNEDMYGRNQSGTWVKLTPAQQTQACVPSSGVCKVVYEEGYTPVTGTDADEGFIRIEQNNGHLNLP